MGNIPAHEHERNGDDGQEPPVSVVTYTYNDGDLLHGLLAEIPLWTRQPREVLVVDDGSRPAFSLISEQEKRLPLRILRNGRNTGFRSSKARGINAAAHEYILSLDCDSRVSPNFLEIGCRRLAADPRLGMAAGACRDDSGTDTVSRYQRFFGDNHHCGAHGQVDFLPGLAFVLRRSAWNAVGGFGSHARRACEDHALCAALRASGYALFVDGSISVRQVRRLSRHTHCLRLWSWMGPEVLARIDTALPLPAQLAALFLPPLSQRCRLILELGDVDLLYIELLYLLSLCLATLDALQHGEKPAGPEDSPEALLAAYLDALAPRAQLAALLREDVVRLGFGKALVNAVKLKTRGAGHWAPVTAALAPLREHKALDYLDTIAVPLLREEDARVTPDFSSYGENTWKT